MRIFLCFLAGFILILSFDVKAQTTGSTKQKCTDLNLGPYQYNKVSGTPVNLKFDVCVDGTAWTQLFHLRAKFSGTLRDIQKTLNSAINASTNTCVDRDYSVNVSNLKVGTSKSDQKKHYATIAMNVEAKRCSFPRGTIYLSVSIPVTLDSKSIDLTMEEPEVLVEGTLGGIAAFVPQLKSYIVGKTKEQLAPYITDINNLQFANEQQFKLLQPSIKSIRLATNDDALDFDIHLFGRVEKPIFETQSKQWLKDRGLE